MLDALKRELKDLLGAGRLEDLFKRMRASLRDGALRNEIILLEAKFQATKSAGELDLIEPSGQRTAFGQVNYALLERIDGIQLDDLGPSLRRQADAHVSIPAYHAFTCDRVAQKDRFEELHYFPADPAQRVRVFYLHGDARQELGNLFHRLGYELGGHLLNWRKGEYDPGIRLGFFGCKPQASDNPRLFQLHVLRDLLAQFFAPLPPQQPILDKKISDLCRSEALAGFGPDDLVFMLLTIDDHNWRERVTPLVVHELVRSFCQCELPAGAPHFFFFFGIEYAKENAVVQSQARAAIAERICGEALPELVPVPFEQVSAWFSRYDLLRAPGQSADEATRQHFGDFQENDMSDIVRKLAALLEQHNLGLLLQKR